MAVPEQTDRWSVVFIGPDPTTSPVTSAPAVDGSSLAALLGHYTKSTRDDMDCWGRRA